MSDVFDITKVSAERARRGRPPKPKTVEVTEVTLEVPEDESPKMISLALPPKPVDTGTFIAPKEMDPLEEAVFVKTTADVAEGKDRGVEKRLSEKTRLEMERGKKLLRMK
jgi:hypothetical protein